MPSVRPKNVVQFAVHSLGASTLEGDDDAGRCCGVDRYSNDRGGDRTHDLRIKRRPQNTPKPRKFRAILGNHPGSSGV